MSQQLAISPRKLGARLKALFIAGALLVLADGMISHAQPVTPVATVPASITADTTWTQANSPYYVVSDVSIQSGAVVTIEPGVRVIFTGKWYIHVYSGSSIVAKGTPSDHISFERQTDAQRWKKIWFHENTSSYLRYVDIVGGGSDSSGEAGMMENDGPGTHVINNCTLQDSNRQGIAAVGSGLDLRIAGTLIKNNKTFALRVDDGPNVIVTGSTIEKVSDNDGVYVPLRANAPTLVITGSNFLSGAALSNDMASSVCVYAQDNWWGAGDGPSGGGGGACTGVTGNAGGASSVSAGVDWRNYRTSAAPRVGITTAPVVSFTVSPDPSVARPVGTVYTFDAADTTDVEDYTSSLEFCWDWEDDGGGCDATATSPTHSYGSGGWHTARLTVTDTDGLTGTLTQQVLSGWAPTATLNFTQTTWAQIEVDAAGSDDFEDDPGDLKAYWDWDGDGVWDTGAYSITTVVTHTYDHIGRYWLTLGVEDTDGVIGTQTKVVDIIPPAAAAPVDGSGGTLVSTDVTVTVTLGAGAVSSDAVITHTPWITVPMGYSEPPGDFTYQGFGLTSQSLGGQPISGTTGTYTISVEYDLDYYSNVLGLESSTSLLKLYRWSGSEWVLVPFMIDSGQLIATTDSFGDFALVLEAEKVYLPLVLGSY